MTPSTTSYRPTGQSRCPWTDLSVTVAVCWMLSLSFGLAPDDATSGLEGETARVEEALSFTPLASLYSSSMKAWSWQSELLASSSLGGK